MYKEINLIFRQKIKGQLRIIIWMRLIYLESWMFYNKIQGFSVLNKKIFKGFLPHMGMVAILVNRLQPYEQTFTLPQEAKYEI